MSAPEQGRATRRYRRMTVGFRIALLVFAVGWPLPWAFTGLLLTLVPGQGSIALLLFGVAALGPVGAVIAALVWRRLRNAAPARSFSVTVDRAVVARGGSFHAGVTVGGASAPARLAVGLVCTETFEDQMTLSQTRSMRGRSQRRLTAYEHQEHADPSMGGEVALTVPPDAPYSYEGTVIAYAWQVVAREPRGGGPDRVSSVVVEVTP